MATAVVPNRHASAARPANRSYLVFSILALFVIFIGFARTYYLKALFHTKTLTPLVHLHGALMTAWILLLLVQSLLAATNRIKWHKRLGVAGAVLAYVIVLIGVIVPVRAVQLAHAPTGVPPLQFLIVPLGDIVAFGGLVFAALWFRHRPDLHKRLVVVSTASILPPGIARWPWALVAHQPVRFFAVADVLLLAIIVYDVAKTRRLNPAYGWGGSLLIASHPLRLIFAKTAVWLAVARWITGV